MVSAATPTLQAGAGSGATAEPDAGDSSELLLQLLPGRPAPERERSSWNHRRRKTPGASRLERRSYPGAGTNVPTPSRSALPLGAQPHPQQAASAPLLLFPP